MLKYILSILIIFCFVGCDTITPFANPAVSGIIYWRGGEAKKYYEASVPTLHNAVIDSLQELRVPITSKYEYSHHEGYRIVAGENSRFKIKILHKDGNISCIKIRINVFGDKDYTQLIFKTIDKNLLYKKF